MGSPWTPHTGAAEKVIALTLCLASTRDLIIFAEFARRYN